MLFRTEVDVPKGGFEIQPAERMLFVGSCFADNLGRRFRENRFRAVVNPYGVMYNPASILHTVKKYEEACPATDQPRVAVFTLGTNHVYMLKETGEIVDNCMKRPQRLFEERELSVEECRDYLLQAIDTLAARPQAGSERLRVIVTVSPIRYAKYGYHGSMLSKATLLLAADEVTRLRPEVASYFPAYEILNDELRDYRFYKPDMLHPSDQAVEFIWDKFRATYFGHAAEQFMAEWKPIHEALGHRPFNPESEQYQAFLAEARRKERAFCKKYALPTTESGE